MFTQAVQKRPFGVVAIIGLQILSGCLTVVVLYLEGGQRIVSILHLFPLVSELLFLIGTISTLFGFIIAIGLWRLRRWAWVFTMFQLGIRLGADLLAYMAGDAQFLLMFINVITVFYLNQRDVQQAFGQTDAPSQ